MRPDHNRLRELAQSMHESPVTREVVEGLVDLNDRLLDENDRLREALRTTGRMLFAEWYNGNLDEAAYDRIIEGQPLLVEVDTDAAGSRSGSTTGHPCPKPLEVMRWILARCALPGSTVIDPFMGSGTTLRAAADLGMKAIGIDIEERYCEMAARRMFAEPPEERT